MAERQYYVFEPMVTANVYIVRAESQREAIEKAKDGVYDDSFCADVHPEKRKW